MCHHSSSDAESRWCCPMCRERQRVERQRIANSEWRVVKRQRTASSQWQIASRQSPVAAVSPVASRQSPVPAVAVLRPSPLVPRPLSFRRGQAVLLATLIMFVVAAVGAGFILFVQSSMNLSQRAREEQEALLLAQAGLAFADAQLTENGADWRPSIMVDFDEFEKAKVGIVPTATTIGMANTLPAKSWTCSAMSQGQVPSLSRSNTSPANRCSKSSASDALALTRLSIAALSPTNLSSPIGFG
jgi:hypothetical protein